MQLYHIIFKATPHICVWIIYSSDLTDSYNIYFVCIAV